MLAPKWWETRRGQLRLARDREVVGAEQPGLRFVETPTSLMLKGPLVVKTASGIPDEINTEIVFPSDYPLHEPQAFEPDERFQPHDASRHFFTNGRCCLWLDVDSPWDPKDRDGLRTFLDQLAIWFQRQLIFELNPAAGWPGPAWSHNSDAYFEYLLEDWHLTLAQLVRLAPGFWGGLQPKSACPCGSGFQYRRCHQPRIDRFRAKAAKSQLDEMVGRLRTAIEQGRLERHRRATSVPAEKVDASVVADPPAGTTAAVRIAGSTSG